MTVVEAKDSMRSSEQRLCHSAGCTLTIKDGILRVTSRRRRTGASPAHRTFFTSLAEDHGERAVCIVLSGIGSDGRWARAIKEHGGLTMAQAEFDTPP